MAYIKDIIDSGDGVIDYTLTLVGGNKLICEGFKDIVNFSESEIKLKNKKTLITVTGGGLELEKCYSGYISITGDIASINRDAL